MEELVGPEVDVILSLREGHGFGFVSNPILITATLNGDKMESNVYENLGASMNFNMDFVWQSNKSNVRKMRNNMVPIRLELFKFIDGSRREKLGYVILNLKSAQCIAKNKEVTVSEECVKILGLGKECIGYTTQLQISLRIQDRIEETKADLAGMTHSSKSDEQLISIAVVPQEILPKVSQGATFMLSPRSKFGVPQPLPEVTADAPCLLAGDSLPPTTKKPVRRVVQSYHSFKLKIILNSIICHKLLPKFQFGFNHSRSETVCTAHPHIEVEHVDELVELADLWGEFHFTETPAQLLTLLSTAPPVISLCSADGHTRPVLAKAAVSIAGLTAGGDTGFTETVDLLDGRSLVVVGQLTYTALLSDLGPRPLQDVLLQLDSGLAMKEKDLPPMRGDDPSVTERIVDELEDWKERQKQVIQQELHSRMETEMSNLREDWLKRRQELEESVTSKMEQCRELGDSLIQASGDLQQKTRNVEEREALLEAVRNDFEEKCTILIQEKAGEVERLRVSFEEQLTDRLVVIEQLREDVSGLSATVTQLQEQKQMLQNRLTASETELDKYRNKSLSEEQTAALLQDLKTMQERLEAAVNSKMFFKEQWGRAVREIHRIKSECSKEIHVQLQSKRDELSKLGLEQLYQQEKVSNRLDRDDVLDAKDFLCGDFAVRASDKEYPYKSKTDGEVHRTNMDVLREKSVSAVRCSKDAGDKLARLIEERDRRLQDDGAGLYDVGVARLNKEIRQLLEH